jgi:hypothetical protein
MDDIEPLIEAKRRELRQSLGPIFGEDSNNTAAMLVGTLRREFGDPIKEDNWPRFLAALARLPRGSNAKPVPLINRHTDGPPFGLIFLEGSLRYESSRRFDTEDAANAYASDFLVRLRGEANRKD